MPQTMPIKWTNLMMTSVIMMSMLNANMFFNKNTNMKKQKSKTIKTKKPNWKW